MPRWFGSWIAIKVIRPVLVIDRTPVVVDPPLPPAYVRWGGPPQIEIQTSGKNRGASVDSSVTVTLDPQDKEKKDEDRDLPGPGVLVMNEQSRAETEITVTSDDGKCSVSFKRIDAVVFDLPQQFGQPLGTVLVMKFKAS